MGAVALHVSGYTWQDIAQCVRWMSAFAFALRERSPLQPKSFHGIQPDDAHHLQTHAVDLDLLGRAQDRLHALATGGLRESPDPASQSQLPMGLDNTPQEEEGEDEEGEEADEGEDEGDEEEGEEEGEGD